MDQAFELTLDQVNELVHIMVDATLDKGDIDDWNHRLTRLAQGAQLEISALNLAVTADDLCRQIIELALAKHGPGTQAAIINATTNYGNLERTYLEAAVDIKKFILAKTRDPNPSVFKNNLLLVAKIAGILPQVINWASNPEDICEAMYAQAEILFSSRASYVMFDATQRAANLIETAQT